jgi:hypothetical protein
VTSFVPPLKLPATAREQAFALERERNDLIRGDTEQRERTEREMARLRRERDSAVRQRDALRERADVLLERQQHLLEDISRTPRSPDEGMGETKARPGVSRSNSPRIPSYSAAKAWAGQADSHSWLGHARPPNLSEKSIARVKAASFGSSGFLGLFRLSCA